MVDKLEGHRGVVDHIDKEGNIFISLTKRGDKQGYQWLFPEEADVHITVDFIFKSCFSRDSESV